jgi:hypothetical protein
MALSSAISKVRMRPPVEAQATCVAGSSGWPPLVLATWDGAQMVSPSPTLMKALPAFWRETRFSAVARKP